MSVHLDRPITLLEICEATGVSERTLIHAFRERTGRLAESLPREPEAQSTTAGPPRGVPRASRSIRSPGVGASITREPSPPTIGGSSASCLRQTLERRSFKD